MCIAPHFSYLDRSRLLYNEGRPLLYDLGSGVSDELRFEFSAFRSKCFAYMTKLEPCLRKQYTRSEADGTFLPVAAGLEGPHFS